MSDGRDLGAPAGVALQTDIAIVGAGMAGLACASALVSAGHHVAMFDKSGAVSGRSATRTTHGRLFDHGAPGVRTADVQRGGERFESLVAEWLADGILTEWEQDWLVAPRGMRSLGESLAQRLPNSSINTRREVSALLRSPTNDGWRLAFRDANGEASGAAVSATPGTRAAHAPAPRAGPFAHVVLAVPAPQAARLLPADHAWQSPIGDVQYAPCWAVLATVTSRDTATPKTPIVRCNDPLPGVAWCDSAKPGRYATDGEQWWTLHADADWSVAHLEDSADTIAHRGRIALASALDIDATNVSTVAHRWRYANVVAPLHEQPFLNDWLWGLSCTGDWCAGSGIASAWQSGALLGEVLAAQLHAMPPSRAQSPR